MDVVSSEYHSSAFVEPSVPAEINYMLISPNAKLIRIGWSKDTKRKLARIKSQLSNVTFGHPGGAGDAKLLLVWRSNKTYEDQMHDAFEQFRFPESGLRSNSIYYREPLMPFIAHLWELHKFVGSSIEDYESRCRRHMMDISQWWPPEKHRSARFFTSSATHVLEDTTGQRYFDVTRDDDEDAWKKYLPERIKDPDDYYCPVTLFEPIRTALGGQINFDPCTHFIANEKIRAKNIFIREDGGLLRPWSDGVWLNPPFDEWGQWANKALKEIDDKRVSELIAICGARMMSRAYGEQFMNRVTAICVPHRYLTWWGKNGNDGEEGAHDFRGQKDGSRTKKKTGRQSPNSAEEAHVILYIGNNIKRFSTAFAEIGNVFSR